jgi:ElaB/YqjD/DUF883 family membrane-anchored ribosome-binding protein
MKNRIFDTRPNGLNGPSATATADKPPIDMQKIKEGLSDVSTFVAENPAACLGAAFSVGILLGWVVKRS